MDVEKEYTRYAKALSNASMLAQRELAKIWDGADLSDPEGVRDMLLVAVPGIVERYGNMAALAAAQHFETQCLEATGEEWDADLAETVPAEQVESAVRYACGHLFREGDGDGV